MSDILIKGMEMPIGCGWRTENAYTFAQCPLYERCLEKGIRLTRESRPKNCPLVEVKEAKTGVVYPTESKMWVEAST